MKGVWKVFSNDIGDQRMYIVGRVRDTAKTVHSGNMEYHGGYTTDREEALRVAQELNEKEAATCS